MKAQFVNDAALGPGYGLFVVSETAVGAQERLGFGVRRSSDGRFLGKTGWQDAEEPLWPDETRQSAEGLVLAVSPAVVNRLDELDPCRFSLYRADGTRLETGSLLMAGIAYGDMTAGGAVLGAAPAAAPPPQAPEPLAPEPAPVAEDPPLPELAVAPAPKKGLPGWVLALLVGVALLGIGAFVWLSASKPATPPPVAESKAPEETAKPEPVKPEPSEPAKPEPAKPEPKEPESGQTEAAKPQESALSPKERVRVFLREGGKPEGALALSRELPKDSVEGQDAVFLLLEVAAEGGNPDAMLGLAAYYDPLSAAPAGTLQKDPEQAWNWYSKAAKASGEAGASAATGPAAEANKALAALEIWLGEQAKQGGAEAEALLKRLKK